MKDNSFFALNCEKCGNPLYFDIVTQNYCCQACGAHNPAEAVTKRIRQINNKDKKNVSGLLDLQLKTKSVYECRNCGATMVSEGELAKVCGYCGSTLAKADYSGEDFPVSIIPFYITRDEAIAIFRKWAASKWKSNALKLVLDNIEQNLQMHYLPYRMVKGDFMLSFLDRKKQYEVPACLYGIYVSERQNISNSLLDAVEPFDISEFVDFDFKYIAGHRTLMPDISEKQFKDRRDVEIVNAYRPTVDEALGEDYRNYSIKETQNLVERSVYIPMFTLSVDGKSVLAINGQTGRLAFIDGIDIVTSDKTFYKRAYRELRLEDRNIEEYRSNDMSFRSSFWQRTSNTVAHMLEHSFIYVVIIAALGWFVNQSVDDYMHRLFALGAILLLMFAVTFINMPPVVDFVSASSKVKTSDNIYFEYLSRDSRKRMFSLIGIVVFFGALLFMPYFCVEIAPRFSSSNTSSATPYYVVHRFWPYYSEPRSKAIYCYYWADEFGVGHYHSEPVAASFPDVSEAGIMTDDGIYYKIDKSAFKAPAYALVSLSETGDGLSVLETSSPSFSNPYMVDTSALGYFFCKEVDDQLILLPNDSVVGLKCYEHYKKTIRKKTSVFSNLRF